jgi:hypothetical protein
VKPARTDLHSRNMASVRLFRVILPVSRLVAAQARNSNPGYAPDPRRAGTGGMTNLFECWDRTIHYTLKTRGWV